MAIILSHPLSKLEPRHSTCMKIQTQECWRSHTDTVIMIILSVFRCSRRWAEIPTCQCANGLDSLTTWTSNASNGPRLSEQYRLHRSPQHPGVDWFGVFCDESLGQNVCVSKQKRIDTWKSWNPIFLYLFKLIPIFPVEKFNQNLMRPSGLLSWRCCCGRWSFPSMPWPWNSSCCAGQCLWVKLRKAEVALHHRSLCDVTKHVWLSCVDMLMYAWSTRKMRPPEKMLGPQKEWFFSQVFFAKASRCPINDRYFHGLSMRR